MKELDFNKLAHEWTPCQEKTFSITVRCWKTNGVAGIADAKYVWNVYANIYETHPLFGNFNEATSLHFHGGCTYDKFVTTEHCTPEAERAAWMHTSRILKVGSDYSHYMDDEFEASDPADGVPWAIQRDVLELASQLATRAVQMLESPAVSVDELGAA